MPMQIIRDIRNLPVSARGSVVAIGNFDGLHLGHQIVIQECMRIAKEKGKPSAVLTFEPHPRHFFKPDAPPLSLMTLPEKAAVLETLGVDILFVAAFNADLSGLTAQAFIDTVLARGLGVAHIVTGEDFVFGQGRGGSRATLEASAVQGTFGFSFVRMANNPHPGPPASASLRRGECTPGSPEFEERRRLPEGEGVKISSTRIREVLSQGDPAAAAALLGRPYAISGRVVHGDGRGRGLGFATANIELTPRFLPLFGIYAIRGQWRGKTLGGVASLGIRPMFASPKPLLEVHFFDFDGSLYGDEISVEFLAYLRSEQTFASQQELVKQMQKDSETARAILLNI